MQDPALQQQTASEPLSLEEEYEMQQSWRDDADKLTFIVLAKERAMSEETSVTELLRACSMAGDVNVFLSERYEDEDDMDAPSTTWGELEVMIAEPHWRRQGLAREALRMLLHYITTEPPMASDETTHPFPLPMNRLFARISMDNDPSLALFCTLGFSRVKENAVFEEVEMGLAPGQIIETQAPQAILSWPEA
ncbi:N-acetyltransferase [Malassezia pachydermatis]